MRSWYPLSSKKKLSRVTIAVGVALLAIIVVLVVLPDVGVRDQKPSLSWEESEVRLKPEETKEVRLSVDKNSLGARLEIVDVKLTSTGWEESKRAVSSRALWLDGFEGEVEKLNEEGEYVYRLHIPRGTPTGVYSLAVKASGEVDELSVLKVTVDSEQPQIRDLVVDEVKLISGHLLVSVWNGGSIPEEAEVKVELYKQQSQKPLAAFESDKMFINEHNREFARFVFLDQLEEGIYFAEVTLNTPDKETKSKLPVVKETTRDLNNNKKSKEGESNGSSGN